MTGPIERDQRNQQQCRNDDGSPLGWMPGSKFARKQRLPRPPGPKNQRAIAPRDGRQRQTDATLVETPEQGARINFVAKGPISGHDVCRAKPEMRLDAIGQVFSGGRAEPSRDLGASLPGKLPQCLFFVQ